VFFGDARQLKDHGQSRVNRAATFGLPSAMADRGKGALNGIGGTQVHPVLGWIIIEAKQRVLVLAQALARFRILGVIKLEEPFVFFQGSCAAR